MSGDATAPRLMLATKFPEQYIRDTIEPNLRAIGATVSRVVSVDFDGQIRDIDAIAFMFQMCSHTAYDNFKQRAKTAGVPFVLLSRKSAEWLTAFRMAGIRLPVARAEKPSLPVPPPPVAPVPAAEEPTPPPPTFGAALRLARVSEEVTQAFIAELCGTDQTMVSGWERGRHPISLECYEKLTELFPTLAVAPAPEITRRQLARRIVDPPRSEPKPIEQPASAKVNGHPGGSSLIGLLRAARALGIQGDVSVCFDEAAATVKIGLDKWQGATPDDAIAAARTSLGERLNDLLRRVTEARNLLAFAPEGT